jgi:hypothetical protein
MDLRYEGVKRDSPLPPGSISVIPAGSSLLWHRQGSIDTLFVSLEPSQVAQIATESFEFDPSQTVVPPVVGLNLPQLRFAMLAVEPIDQMQRASVSLPFPAFSLAPGVAGVVNGDSASPLRLRKLPLQ